MHKKPALWQMPAGPVFYTYLSFKIGINQSISIFAAP